MAFGIKPSVNKNTQMKHIHKLHSCTSAVTLLPIPDWTSIVQIFINNVYFWSSVSSGMVNNHPRQEHSMPICCLQNLSPKRSDMEKKCLNREKFCNIPWAKAIPSRPCWGTSLCLDATALGHAVRGGQPLRQKFSVAFKIKCKTRI